MRPEELLEFDAAEYSQRAATHSTSHLQQQELVKIRQCMKADFQVGAGTLGTIATGGLTFVQPLYASREGYIAEKKLKLIQAELTKRGVKLHESDGTDRDAALIGSIVGSIAGDGADEAAVGDSVPEGALQHVTAQMVAGDIAQQAVAETTDAPPAPGGCSRSTLPKWFPLRCNNCGTCLDSSITTYFHCCTCDNDDFDLCGSCALAPKSLSHVKGHVLHKMQPKERPRVHSSVRGALGNKITCNGCGIRLKNVDIYTCEDCLGSYDVCLSCYASGKTCSRHSNVLQRKHVKSL